MNISYRRSINKNFMIIDPEDLNWEGYECSMIINNDIEGFLRMRTRQGADGTLFYYDITSRQPLARLLNGAQWGAEEFRSFMQQICDILKRLDSYLLKENRILFDEDHIYVEPGSRRLFLCYVPGMERLFAEDLGNLLERLLECVDHRDKECVVLAYGLYQETRKEDYVVDDLMRQIYSLPVTYNEEVTMRDHPENLIELQDEAKLEDAAGKNSGFFEKLINRVFPHLPESNGKKDEKEREEENEEDLWFAGFEEEQEEKIAKVSAPETPALGDTLILSGIRPNINTHVLRSLKAGIEDIPISYYPFVIGKQEDLVDHRLDEDTVSRLHLKIERRDDRYMIEDLNSTNGTSLNGEMLENNEEREITPGDEIGIAGFRFRFE